MPKIKLLSVVVACLFCSCKTTHYYVVRHAEKGSIAGMTTDVPLSEAGKLRADALKDTLAGRNIQAIYTTNFLRTRSTAQPLAEKENITLQFYKPYDTSFIALLKSSRKNFLIVGHSNTIDNLVNELMGMKMVADDLPESRFGDLFVITRKGKKYKLERKHFGN